MAAGRSQYHKNYRVLSNKVKEWLDHDVDSETQSQMQATQLDIMEVVNHSSDSEVSSENEIASVCETLNSSFSSQSSSSIDGTSSSDESMILEVLEDEQACPIDGVASSLQSELARWVVEAKVSREHCNNLLALLRKFGAKVPKDSRTLLKTPRVIPVIAKCGGQYLYFGLQKVLHSVACFGKCPDILEIQMSADGLPLFKSSCTQLWPILCSVSSSKPMVVALYIGQTKPKSVSEFLDDFVSEVSELQTVGFVCSICKSTDHRKVLFHSIIADAPARSFLKNIKGHNSLHGCERCLALGVSISSRTTFASDDCFNAEKRCNTKFGSTGYLGTHQHGPTPLNKISSNCVDLCALDYMHLVCLGTVRRMLHYWKSGDRLVKLSSSQILQISYKLIALRSFIPSEFARRPRSLIELDRWKATELRQFLLYTGPVVLKSLLPSPLYKSFLTLSVAVSILLMQDTAKRLLYIDYAAKLLHHFVFNCAILYGDTFLVYNIHSLLHLADDSRNFGTSLDSVSAFPYENYLKTLKHLVRSPANPIAQIAKRIEEFEAVNTVPPISSAGSQTPRFKVSSKHVRDSVIFLKIGKFAEIVERRQDTLICEVYTERCHQPFYTDPCSSELLGVFFIANSSKNSAIKTVTWDQVECKGMKMPCGDGFVFMPLLHREAK